MVNGEALERFAEEVIEILSRSAQILARVRYPKDKRSIDIVALTVDPEFKILVKVVLDSKHLTTHMINDLKKASKALGAKPIVVSKFDNNEEIEPDLVVVKKGINIVSSKLLVKYFEKKEKPIVAKIRGNLILRINREKFRERRLELNYSLGRLAEVIGVSRKAVYDYETGVIDVSLTTAIRIAEVLGEDVFQEIDPLEDIELKDTQPDEPLGSFEHKLMEVCNRIGAVFYRLSRTPIDYILSGNEASLTLTLAGRDVDYREVKINEAQKLSKILGVENVVVEKSEDLVELIRRT